MLQAARQAVADLVNADPRGVVLGADRAILLTSLADAASSRVGLGHELVVTRLDDEANIAPWLRAANRYGAKVKWAEVDIETGELPAWQWETLIDKPTKLVAVTSASSAIGTVTDLRPVTKLVHEDGGTVVVDHSAAAPYRLIDIHEIEADVVAINAVGWGGPPIGALVFRDPAMIETFARCRRPLRDRGGTARDGHAPVRHARRRRRQRRIPGQPRRVGPRHPSRKTLGLNAIGDVLHGPAVRLPADVAAFIAAGDGDRAARVAHTGAQLRGPRRARRTGRAAAGGQRRSGDLNANSRVLDVIGVNDIGGAVTVGLAHYTTMAEVDQLVRALASLG